MKKLIVRVYTPNMPIVKFKCDDIFFDKAKKGGYEVVGGDFMHLITITDNSILISNVRLIYKIYKLIF